MVSGEIDMFDRARKSFACALLREQICHHLLSGKGSESKRLNEFPGGSGHNDLNLMALRLEGADQFRSFISRDAAADS
jgi:hypothetical protein